MKFETIFLQHNDEVVTYRELHSYARGLFANRLLSDGIYLIEATPRFQAIMQIAACWLNGVPFSVLPADKGSLIYRQRIKELRSQNSDVQQNDLFAVLFTSGTTDIPKMVPINRENVVAAYASGKTNYHLLSDEKWIHTLPLNHIGGISIITRALLGRHGIHLLDEFDSAVVQHLLSSDLSVTGISMVPTQLRKLLEGKHISVHGGFKGVLLGGGPVNTSDIMRCKEIHLPVTPSFGMTETTAQCLATPLEDWDNAPAGTCGKPLAGVEVELRADPESPNSSLLWVRGEQVFNGYANWDNSKVFDEEGWFCTGDYAQKDNEGYYYIQMRRSDRIVTGGENVNPIEVEHHLTNFAELLGDYVIIGLPDELWGQAVTLVTTKKEHPDIDKIRAFLSTRIERFKIPKSIQYIPHIPRTASGKPMRFKLCEILSE
ncbi:MAG: AMP-binding protein [Bacteroidetes bacterium]|nr:AMP-binding protein [Bacteroidota bacterium]MCH8524370.1 AMP-binding protein [Balneolales bacterium]